MALLLLVGCSNKPPYDTSSAMQRAMLKLPPERSAGQYNHFKLLGEREDFDRILLNFLDTVEGNSVKIISIECLNVDLCEFILLNEQLKAGQKKLIMLQNSSYENYATVLQTKGFAVKEY